jgi:hypothetical protein
LKESFIIRINALVTGEPAADGCHPPLAALAALNRTKTEAGKARIAMNALRHGQRSRAWIERARRIRRAIRLCADTALLARAFAREQKRLALRQQLQRTGALCSAARSPFPCDSLSE